MGILIHQRGRAGVGNAADGFAVAGRVGWVFLKGQAQGAQNC